MSSWFKDFEIKDKKIVVKATGAELPLNLNIIKEALDWFPFYVYEKLRRLKYLFSAKKRLIIAYSPVTPRPWYLLAVLADRARLKQTKDFTKADVLFYFEDQTLVEPPQIPADFTGKAFNFGCYDISKSKVATTFEKVFGYNLTVDPHKHKGPIAVKSEKNGAHDGYQTVAPLPAKKPANPDMVYQKLINNTVDEKWAEDMRCPIIGGEIALVFVKRRPLEKRFANLNSSVVLHEPNALLSDVERSKLKEFAKAMHLDWGGMDVLRNKDDGKIYVVDVNKTDMGPPIALSISDKSKSVAILTKQLMKLIGQNDQANNG